MAKFLSLQDVSKTYGSVDAVSNVSIEIQRGELVTLLGPSGSGKTTLLMTIAGFVQPDCGDILLQAHSILRLPPYKRNIGIVFQQYALFPHMTTSNNIAYPLRVRRVSAKERKRAVEEVLDLVQLSGFGDRLPNELSGGQQQRVALARALVFRPQILLMDEPLGALDRKLRAEMQLEVRRIQQHLGITTVYVTHDQEEALTISDRIAVMSDGQVIELGTAVEMYEKPNTEFVVDFLGESNLLRGQVIDSDDGFLRIKTTKGLSIQAEDKGQFCAGDQVVVALRPERIAFGGKDVHNEYTGIVQQVVYLGGTLRIVILINDESFIATVNRHDFGELPNDGDEICVGWDVGAPIVLRPKKE